MSLLNPVFSTENVRYRDGKRYAWFVSLLVPAVLGCGPLLYALTGSVAGLWIPAALITAVVSVALLVALGAIMIPYLMATYFISAFHLTLANYVEHYGLLRQKRANGMYERCQPHHSWNSNHSCSNWATYHLQRHSDHHANPGRRYQALRHFDGLPTLPNGYFGMFLVAVIPPLWFRVMDPLLLAHAERDPARINFDPKRRELLCARYGLEDRLPVEDVAVNNLAAA